jgi:hypothetical protein
MTLLIRERLLNDPLQELEHLMGVWRALIMLYS